MMEKEILILGHPRSGTGYMAKLFQANGYDIGHEVMGKDGTSNWQFAVCADAYPFNTDNIKRDDVEFSRIYHVIRNPLAAINSIVYTESRSEHFRAKFVPLVGNAFERAILSYYGWNMLIQAQKPYATFTLENAADFFFFEDVKKQNTREHKSVTEDELYMLCGPGAWSYYEAISRFYNQLFQSEVNGA